jgi:1-acyl-sn-glycerol-3-phosphate acyltransferase
VVEFLDPIPPGLTKEAFMSRLSGEVESRSNALMAEAGFPGGASNAVD